MTRLGGRFLKDPYKQEVPTGTVNGSNVTFLLSTKPSEVDSVIVILDGLIQKKTTHYSVGGVDNKTITMVDAPVSGQQIEVIYVEEN